MKNDKNKLIGEVMYKNITNSGVKVFILPKKDYKEKEAMVIFDYGSIHQEFILNNEEYQMPLGIAHFLEHKMFDEKWGNIFGKFTEQGANANAFTNFTSTAYYFSCVNDFYKNFEDLLGFVQRPYFTDESVEKEKGIIEQEIKMYEDDPYWIMFFSAMKAMYQNCLVKNNIAGTVDEIKKINKDMLYTCHRAFYNPSNMAVVVVGDVNVNEVMEKTEKLIKAANSICLKKITPSEPETIFQKNIYNKLTLSRTVFQVGIKEKPVVLTERNYSKYLVSGKILMDIIAGISGDFYKKMYNKNILTEPLNFDYQRNNSFSHYMFSGFSKKPGDFFSYLKEEIERCKRDGIDDKRFKLIKNKHLGRYIREFNSINNITMMQAELCYKNIDVLNLLESYEMVCIDDITKMLHEGMVTEHMVLSVIEPKNDNV